MPRWMAFAFLLLLALLLTLPVLSLGASWLQFDAAARDVLHQMAQTVLPDYALTTVVLCLCVALGVALVGMGTASAVTLFDFPGRRVFEWALLLPLAMPAYVVAYAYTDFLQFSGPLQVGLREAFGLRGRVFPEIRNTPGAVWVFTFSLYPYVYLLARTALSERASQLMEAARLLGAPLSRRIREVALPLARPAVAAGVALALMETLADFGVASYFGIQTFTAGIYKAWLSMDMPLAAAQLATMLLAIVALLLWLEHRAQRRMRFASQRGQRAGSAEAQPVRLVGARSALAVLVCGLPVLFGFVLPVLFMLRPLIGGWEDLPWAMFVQWSRNSVWLAGLSALLATALALMLAFALRTRPSAVTRGGAARQPGLRGAGGGDRGGSAAAGGLGAGGAARVERGLLDHGHGAGHRLGLHGALHRGGPAVGAKRLRARARQPGRFGAHARHHRRRPGRPGALAVAQAQHRRRRAAGVRRRHERAARHPGAAALQQRHPGGGDLPAGARRAPG